ncbi:hypothetical protein ACF0H5_005810 [Mactra antiquata]
MILNKTQLMIHPQYKRFIPLSPDLDQECITCTKQGSKSSMFMFIAMSKVLNTTFNIVYPSVNGTNNYTYKVMNTLLRPPFADPEKGSMALMWTSMYLPTCPSGNGQIWVPNHIVPLVDNVPRGQIHSMTEHLNKNNAFTVGSLSLENKFGVLGDSVIDITENNDDTANNNSKAKPLKKPRARKNTAKGKRCNDVSIETKHLDVDNFGMKKVNNEHDVVNTDFDDSNTETYSLNVGSHNHEETASFAPTKSCTGKLNDVSIEIKKVSEEHDTVSTGFDDTNTEKNSLNVDSHPHDAASFALKKSFSGRINDEVIELEEVGDENGTVNTYFDNTNTETNSLDVGSHKINDAGIEIDKVSIEHNVVHTDFDDAHSDTDTIDVVEFEPKMADLVENIHTPYKHDLSTIMEEPNNTVRESLNSSDDLSSDNLSIDSDVFTPGPLGNKFLDINCTVQILRGPHTQLEDIPIGRKDGKPHSRAKTDKKEKKRQNPQQDRQEEMEETTSKDTSMRYHLNSEYLNVTETMVIGGIQSQGTSNVDNPLESASV